MPDTINTQLTRIETAKSDIADAIEAKHVEVPSGTKIDGMASLIMQIPVDKWVPEESSSDPGHIEIKLMTNAPKLYYGTTTPANSLGANGDTYIKY